MKRRTAAFVTALVLSLASCGGGSDNAAEDADHQHDLALEETAEVTAHLVPVPGYRFVNVSGLEIGDAADYFDEFERQIGGDLIDGFSLHSVVADDPSQNTARDRRGNDEVGFLMLVGYTEPVPSELEADLAVGIAGEPLDEVITIEGTTLHLFENEEEPDSRFTYIWFGTDHQAGFDGADREPMEAFLREYLSQPGSV